MNIALAHSAPGISPSRSPSRLSAVAATVIRITLGVLWVHEGYVKYHAGFGAADIDLVVQSTASNSRVPHFYQLFTADLLGRAEGFFGVMIPLIEIGLGVALIVGVAPRAVALLSTFQLCTYWFADQLIAQYPFMVLLSALVIASGSAATVYAGPAVVRSLTTS